MKSFLKGLFDIKNWKKRTMITWVVVLIIIAVCIVLSFLKPSEADMKAMASPEMQEMIKADESSSRKRVTVTYNSLIIVNYCSFSTSGAKEITEKYVGFVGKAFQADEGFGKFAGQMVNYTYRMLGCGENILHGAKLTLFLTTASTLIGVVLGTLLALGKISKNKVLSKFCSGYIFFFRGTPLMIQLFVIYYTLPAVFGFAWRDLFSAADNQAVYKGAFIAALIAYGLNSGAYCAEIVRAAIQSIEKGQHEAAKALGLSYGQTMRLIIIPQSVRRMVPPVCNEFIMMLTEASLVFAISLMDITTISKNIMTSEISYIVFLPALVIYLIITAFFTWIFNAIEKKFSLYE